MRKAGHETREDFEKIRQQISIETIAGYLLQKQGKMYIYPGERTGSIKVYPNSNTFYDFGRAVGGDCVKLWSHVRNCDSWTALKEIRKIFGLNAPDRANSRDLIRQQEQARKQQFEAEKEAKCRWVRQIDELKAECSLYQTIVDSGHFEPFSWTWCIAMNGLTNASGKADMLCGI